MLSVKAAYRKFCMMELVSTFVEFENSRTKCDNIKVTVTVNFS